MSIFNFKKKERVVSLKKDGLIEGMEEINKHLFELAPEAVLVVDKRGKVLRVNKKIKEWLGYSEKEIVGLNFARLPFLTKKSRNKLIKSFALRKLQRKISPYEIECITKDNKNFFGTLTASIVKNSKGDFIGELVVVSNITETHQAKVDQEKIVNDLTILSKTAVGFVELSLEDDIFSYIGKKLNELVGDSIIMINSYDNSDQTITVEQIFGLGRHYNKVMKILGIGVRKTKFPLADYAKKKLLGRTLHQISGVYEYGQGKIPKVAAKTTERLFSATAFYVVGFSWKGTLYGSANIVLRRNEKIREESVRAFLYQASVALQRRESEKALKKAHDELEVRVQERTADLEQATKDLEKFKMAVEDASDHIMITDPEGIILYANKAAQQITGYLLEEMIGKTSKLWGEDKKFYKKLWETIKDKKETFVGETSNVRKNGKKYISEAHIAPVLDNKKKILFCVWIERDITKAKEIDQAKTEFVSLASHQLRTPLSAINWYSEMLLSDKNSQISKDQKKYINRIFEASQRMADLVNALLNVSRIELGTFSIQPKKIDLVGLSKSVIEELGVSIKKNKINLKEEYQSSLPEINADPNLTRIIFQNLLSNAVKYTPQGGTVGIKISKDKINQIEVIKIIVKDTGYGIPIESQGEIFTKLFRADNIKEKVSEGTGLGLYIVKSILDHSGGKIWFKSEEDKGTTFFVTIPVSGMVAKSGTRHLSISKQ